MPRTSPRSSSGHGRRALAAALFVAALVGGRPTLGQDVTAVRPTAAQLSAERLRALDQGEVEVSSNKETNGNRFVVYAVVKTTPDRVFEIIQDFAGTTRWVPDQTEATVLERRGAQLRGRIKTHMPWPFSDRHVEMWVENYQATVGGVSSLVNRWQSIHGSGNLDDTHGYWLVQPHPSHEGWTLLKYVVYADVGVALPRFLIRWGTNSVMRESIYNLRQRLGLAREED